MAGERRSTRSARKSDTKSKGKQAADPPVETAADPIPVAGKEEEKESVEASQPMEEEPGGTVPAAEEQQPAAAVVPVEESEAADFIPLEMDEAEEAGNVQEVEKAGLADVVNKSASANVAIETAIASPGVLKSKVEEPVKSSRNKAGAEGDGNSKDEKDEKKGDKSKESGRNHREGGEEKRENVGEGKSAGEKKDHKRGDDKRGDDKRVDDKRGDDKRVDEKRGDEKKKEERPRGERSDRRKDDERRKDEDQRKEEDRSKRSGRERDPKREGDKREDDKKRDDDKKRESDRHKRDGDRHKDEKHSERSKRDEDRKDDRSKREEGRSKRDDDRSKREPRKEEDKSRRDGDKEKRDEAPRKEKDSERRSDRNRDGEKDVPLVALPPPPPLPPNTEVEKVNLDEIKDGGEKAPAKDPPAAKEEKGLSRESDRRGDDRRDRSGRRSPPREKDRRERDRFRERGGRSDRDRERERDRGRRPLTPPRRKHRSRSRSLSPRDARSTRRASPRRRSPPSSRPSNKRAGYYSSGLGGYSPRRRKNGDRDSPSLSPDRKRSKGLGGAWDQPPPGMDAVAVALWQQQMAVAQQMAAAAGANPFIAMGAASNLPNLNPLLAGMGTAQNPSVTRSARRLYIGNLPPTVSDGEVLEFLNAAIISGGQQHVPGTRPVAAVQLTLDKGFGFADFTHPEDASIGTLLDGIVLHGNALKIRRPRDYVQPPTELAATAGAMPAVAVAVGLPGQPVVATPGTVTTASSIPLSAIPQNIVPGFISTDVPDSPNKIFLGNIHPSITAEKLREILTAFGQLKHYVMKHNKNTKPFKVYAFLEYMDSAVTPQAIAGLSGLMLARKPLVSAYATPGVVGGGDKEPFYGVPEFAKPLLEEPSKVLEISNVLTREDLLRLTEEETEEIVEDVTLECARFGTVKSSHVPKPVGVAKKEEESDAKDGIVKSEEGTDSKPGLLQNGEAAIAGGEAVTVPVTVKTEPMDVDERKPEDGTVEDANEDGDDKKEVALLGAGGVKKEEEFAGADDPEGVGKLYVEFSREESAIRAAHALHNRMYNGRRVMVGYLPVKFYQKRYNKGFGLSHKSYDERQELSIKVQDFLYGPV